MTTEKYKEYTTVPSYTFTIYVGLKNRDTGKYYFVETAERIIQEYVDKVGLCVSVTELDFFYTHGNEHGLAIGLINYPRFPYTYEGVKERALELGSILLDKLEQYRVTVVGKDETIMISNQDKVWEKLVKN